MRVHEEQNLRSAHDQLKFSVAERVHSVLMHVEPLALRKAMQHGAVGVKMVRPILTMLSSSSVGGSSAAALDAATAIELLHVSSLIHDDIMDESQLRRGLPTTHTTFGVPMAILAGDTFISLAFQLIQSLRSPNKDRIHNIFVHSFRAVCEGQGFDLSLSCYDNPEQETHKKMVEKKTAKLIEAACAIGALLGTVNEEHIQALSRFGFNLGMAFQAQDDVLDETGCEQRMGKPSRIDLKNNKRTFLTLAYPGNAQDCPMPGLSTARNLIAEYTREAEASLEVLPPSEAREMLCLLAHSLTSRTE